MIIHNDHILPEKDFFLTLQNRGFRFGDGLFETIRIANGKICLLDKHLARLERGMRILKLETPIGFNLLSLSRMIEQLSKTNDIIQGGRIRITFYRDSKGLYTPETNKSSYIIEASPLAEATFVQHEGIKICIYDEIRKPISSLSSFKSINSTIYVLAGIYKAERNLDDSILINERNELVESTSSNLFIVKKGILYTPPKESGAVEGIMQQHLIEIAQKNKLEVKQFPLFKEDLLTADEVFLTNSIAGIKWVEEFETIRYENKVASYLLDILNSPI